MIANNMCQIQRLAEGRLRRELRDTHNGNKQDLVGKVAEGGEVVFGLGLVDEDGLAFLGAEAVIVGVVVVVEVVGRAQVFGVEGEGQLDGGLGSLVCRRTAGCWPRRGEVRRVVVLVEEWVRHALVRSGVEAVRS